MSTTGVEAGRVDDLSLSLCCWCTVVAGPVIKSTALPTCLRVCDGH